MTFLNKYEIECSQILLMYDMYQNCIEKYNTARKKAAEIGIKWHVEWYKRQIIILLKKQIAILEHIPAVYINKYLK